MAVILKNMQVILKEDIEKLGTMGEIIEVKRGYARNYLIPQNFALEATPNNLKQLEHQKRIVGDKIKKVKKESETVADKIAQANIVLFHKAGEEDKLFGSVTSMEIAEALMEKGIEIDRRKIVLDEPIKRLGEYNVPVKLAGGVVAELKLTVSQKETA
jgi:large subunit ribosomal protein L9